LGTEFSSPEEVAQTVNESDGQFEIFSPYTSPPLDLLPEKVVKYVEASATSLNVDVSFILLPLLSAAGSAIGNARSIFLKRNFLQPPVIWTAIIGRSGSRKSPSLERGCFAVIDHERELMRQNKIESERYREDLAAWEQQNRKTRGEKPQKREDLTALMDDLTLEALADAMDANPHGILVKKDELSHWIASFDQYRSNKGADIGRWLSLHTSVLFAVDRRTDRRHYRIHQPRVSITGGIQPKVLRRVLTEDFFDRGLPARFLMAAPPMRRDKWNEIVVPQSVEEEVLELFEELRLLQPDRDDRDQARPRLLRLDPDAKAEYIAFYDECGVTTFEVAEDEEAAWYKLTGYAARLALVGQLLIEPWTETVTGSTMKAACALARWFGAEAARIYATFSETDEQYEERKLLEFVWLRGGSTTVREVMQSFRLLKNQREEAETALKNLIEKGFGKMVAVPTTEKGGRPTWKFELKSTKPRPFTYETDQVV
jgi:hypothetical protein